MTTVHLEPFESLAWWGSLVTATIAAGGRNGNCAQIGPSGSAVYPLPIESDTVTWGFAWKVPSVGAVRYMVNMGSDAAGTNHVTFVMNAAGAIEPRRGVERRRRDRDHRGDRADHRQHLALHRVPVKLHDTTGTIIVRVNGTERMNVTAVDTKNVGTKTVFDYVALGSQSTIISLFDDLYVKTGAGETFGDPGAIVAVPTDYSARQNARVGAKYSSPTLARETTRVAVKFTSPTLARSPPVSQPRRRRSAGGTAPSSSPATSNGDRHRLGQHRRDQAWDGSEFG